MNRVKKVLRSKGVCLNEDYPNLPYDICGRFGEPGHISILNIFVNSEKATVTRHFNVVTEKMVLHRNGKITTAIG